MTLKSTFLYIKLFFIAILFLTCSRQDKMEVAENKLSASGLPTMQPSTVKYSKLSDVELENKKASVERYCNKYWSNENNNFSFLVATVSKTLPL